MVNAEETRRIKARELRYRKPIVKNINLYSIKDDLYDITGECEEVRWYWESDDETLINALDGDSDEAYEFKMMFGDLCAECERMRDDMEEEYVPECFDFFFVAIGAGELGGGYLGYDSYEQDYFGLSCADGFTESESAKRLKQLTKDQLIEAAHICFKIYHAYLGIRHRYDCLKASMDILRDQNTGYLQMVKQIEEVYDKANEDNFYSWYQSTKDLERLINCMPQEAWLQ